MFSDVKVGDRVWDIACGYGNIDYVYKNSFRVTFDSFGYEEYRMNGTSVSVSKARTQTLFWQEFEIPETAYQKPLPKLEVDTKVIVWDNVQLKFNKYFSHFNEDGDICCFTEGCTSWTALDTTIWNYWELYEDNSTDTSNC